MDGTNPKISFIPKGSLVRRESFLERPRPRSLVGYLALLAFVVSVGSYAGFYTYSSFYKKDIESMREEISKTEQKLINDPQVETAQLFSSRSNLASSLLESHTVVSPAFKFLSDNTIESIFYNKFSFTQNPDGSKIDLTGEAESYAALVFQADVFRSKKELLDFDISNISLTPFGNVSFSLILTLAPDFFSYSKNLGGVEVETASSTEIIVPPVANISATSSTSRPDVFIATSTSTAVIEEPVFTETDGTLVVGGAADASGVADVAEAQVVEELPFLQKLWSKFKFW